jgi:hypothetical protein
VGITENTADNYFVSVYPNPSNGEINISYKIETKLTDRAFIEMTSITGQVVNKQQLLNTEGKITAKGLNAGIYFVRVINGAEKSVPVKVVFTNN